MEILNRASASLSYDIHHDINVTATYAARRRNHVYRGVQLFSLRDHKLRLTEYKLYLLLFDECKFTRVRRKNYPSPYTFISLCMTVPLLYDE